jgi:DNA-binding NarL/FixJ family response regulator
VSAVLVIQTEPERVDALVTLLENAGYAVTLASPAPQDDTGRYIDGPSVACTVSCDRPAPPLPARESMWPELTEPLTARELAVLALLARRLTNREVADTLCVSWQTVAKYTNNIYQKLRVTSRREAVERAAALGFLSGDVASPHEAACSGEATWRTVSR